MAEKKILSRFGSWLRGEGEPSSEQGPASLDDPETPMPPAFNESADPDTRLRQLNHHLQQREKLLESLRDQRNELLQQLRAADAHTKALEARLKQRPAPATPEAKPAAPAPGAAPAGDLPAEVQHLTERLQQREKLLESLRDQRNELLQQLRAAEAHLKGLEGQSGSASSRSVAALTSQLDQQRQVLEQFRRDKESSAQRVQALEADLQAARTAADESGALAQQQEQSIQQLRAEKDAALAQIQNLENELNASRAAAGAAEHSATEHHQQELVQLRQEKEAVLAQVRNLENELNAARAAATGSPAEQYQQQLDQLRQEKDAALARAAELETALDESRAAAAATVYELEARLKTLEEERNARQASLQEAQSEIEKISARLAAKEEALADTRGISEEAARAIREVSQSLSQLRDTEKALTQAQERIGQLEAELATQKELAEQLRTVQEAGTVYDLTAEFSDAQPPAVEEEAKPEPYDSIRAQAAAGPLRPIAPESPAEPEPAAPPVTEPAAAEPTAPATPKKPVPAARTKKRLLVAEDDPSILRIVEMTLQRAGLDIITARDGEDAFRKVEEEMPDAVLTDLDMPRMNGIELVEKMKATPAVRHIPVGFLTGLRDLEYYRRALELGSTIYITKPFRPDNLVMFANVLLRGRKPKIWRGKPAQAPKPE